MTMEEFWAQNSTVLSLEIFGILAVLILAVVVLRRLNRRSGTTKDLAIALGGAAGVRLFRAFCILLSAISAVTLFVTLLPGATPFKNNVDPTIGLGGTLLFLLWPVIALQLVLYLLPWNKQVSRAPIFSWIVLVVSIFVSVAINKMALGLVFE